MLGTHGEDQFNNPLLKKLTQVFKNIVHNSTKYYNDADAQLIDENKKRGGNQAYSDSNSPETFNSFIEADAKRYIEKINPRKLIKSYLCFSESIGLN